MAHGRNTTVDNTPTNAFKAVRKTEEENDTTRKTPLDMMQKPVLASKCNGARNQEFSYRKNVPNTLERKPKLINSSKLVRGYCQFLSNQECCFCKKERFLEQVEGNSEALSTVVATPPTKKDLLNLHPCKKILKTQLESRCSNAELTVLQNSNKYPHLYQILCNRKKNEQYRTKSSSENTCDKGVAENWTGTKCNDTEKACKTFARTSTDEMAYHTSCMHKLERFKHLKNQHTSQSQEEGVFDVSAKKFDQFNKGKLMESAHSFRHLQPPHSHSLQKEDLCRCSKSVSYCVATSSKTGIQVLKSLVHEAAALQLGWVIDVSFRKLKSQTMYLWKCWTQQMQYTLAMVNNVEPSPSRVNVWAPRYLSAFKTKTAKEILRRPTDFRGHCYCACDDSAAFGGNVFSEAKCNTELSEELYINRNFTILPCYANALVAIALTLKNISKKSEKYSVLCAWMRLQKHALNIDIQDKTALLNKSLHHFSNWSKKFTICNGSFLAERTLVAHKRKDCQAALLILKHQNGLICKNSNNWKWLLRKQALERTQFLEQQSYNFSSQTFKKSEGKNNFSIGSIANSINYNEAAQNFGTYFN